MPQRRIGTASPTPCKHSHIQTRESITLSGPSHHTRTRNASTRSNHTNYENRKQEQEPRCIIM